MSKLLIMDGKEGTDEFNKRLIVTAALFIIITAILNLYFILVFNSSQSA